MNRIRSALNLSVASIFIAANSLIPSEAAGRTNQSVANTILNGKGAPSSALGINGDFYIDISTFNIYGPKSKNKWPTPISLKGPSGASGDKGSATSGAKGEPGEKGTKGEKGEAGAKGETGAQGAAGAQGAQGEQGLTGPTGPQGPQGETGPAGPTGAQGPAGATGATGAAGPSNVYAGSITFANALQGSPGSSQSSGNFANLLAGKSYLFDIIIWAYTAEDAPYLNFAVSAIGASPTITTHWMRATANTYRSNVARTEQAFFGRVAIDGSSTITNFQLAVTVASGLALTDSTKVTLTGGFTGQLVGSVSS